MPCPTCGHTLAYLGDIAGDRAFHCERCGTYLRKVDGGMADVYVPKLVPRVQALMKHLTLSSDRYLAAKAGSNQAYQYKAVLECLPKEKKDEKPHDDDPARAG